MLPPVSASLGQTLRFRHLDMNLLVALDAILTHQNITRASERLCLSQSATSGILSRLREHFEDELVVRTGRQMTLTPLAEELVVPLRAILSDTERLLSMRSAFDPSTSDRQFTIACSDYVWATLILDIISALRDNAPSVNMFYSGPSTRFFKTDIDLLIVPDRFMLEDCHFEPLPPNSYACIVWQDNRHVGTSITLDAFLEARHAQAFSERTTFIESWFIKQFGRAPQPGITAPSFTLLPDALVGTDFIALVPRDLAARASSYLPIRTVNVPFELPVMTDVLQWRRSHDRDPGLQWLRDQIVRVATERYAAQH
ncbi:LysR family transcriptional regulator [Aminobacter ciceronei]|jgi:LysR family nod box-dependent transcriptional activator|uniref:DNA-binding transcriptional LysR family regulator n=3 Tax=Aminobacter TaxID=31988 RepID=A0ABR6CC28_9HYPH|nr:LysR family transcriptional regulator [Aminobacter ciceronei]MBA8908938.1 DNA-binding transcriptional LysR family regulator [Aminobacter ciceronei]MBA9022583.1 DNA-binding transcriptional LysR family regulator [Aminobacter ciceronei]